MGAYICICGNWGFNILDDEIACLGCKAKYPLKRFKRLNGTIIHILEKPETFNKKILKEEAKLKEKEFIEGNPRAKVNYKIVGITDSKAPSKKA